MSLPEVSVIIPTYNGSRFIADALRSVFAQTYLPCEIIVVDDCSTDDTLEVVEGLKSESPVPLKVLKLEKNSGGPARPLNLGIRSAGGDCIAILEQDDAMFPERLERQSSALALCQTASICCGRVYQVTECSANGTKSESIYITKLPEDFTATSNCIAEDVYLIPQKVAFQALMLGNYFCSNSNIMFRRHEWERVGGFDPRWRVNADAAFEFALTCRGPVVLVDKTICRYLIRPDSLFHSNDGMLADGKIDGQLIRLEWALRRPDLSGKGLQEVYWRLRASMMLAIRRGKVFVALRVFRAILRSGVIRTHLRGWPTSDGGGLTSVSRKMA